MSELVLDDGRPLAVPRDGDRIGAGPWARLLASAVVPDESSARAERGRELAWAGMVSHVSVEAGAIRARVLGSSGSDYGVTLEASVLPARVWADAVGEALERPGLEAGIEGSAQSVHLAHYLEAEQREPLVPPMRQIRTSCTCPDREYASVCKHVAAVAFVVADAVDSEPSLLLRWRGCEPVTPPASR
ncbi:MAG: SWIM zinc finger family protein, partial [Gaiella sp.]|uniref:SWIM zinc finger family protein n=1 Tax=Gaiella sp. TaxID=2663207 RepID=UPI003C77B691